MLVIISDTHLTDGTSGETLRVGAFRTFCNRLRDLAYDASWRADGTYKPIEEMHLVLLGDFLDVIRSTKWLVEDGNQSNIRPWDDWHNPTFVSKVQSITAAILARNKDSLAVLKSLKDERTITIPEATAGGRPAEVHWEPDAANRRPVKVHIHYLVGNHDWFYHLPGASYDQIRRTVVDALGADTPADRPFPHDPNESDVIQELYRQYRIFARHGDIYDAFNFEGHRDASSLGDVIVVELIDRFAMTVKEQLGNELPPACIDGLKEIDNLRPTLIIPVWIDGLLQRTCPNPVLQKKVKDVWDTMVTRLIQLPFVQQHHSFFHLFDSVDDLEWGFKFSKGVIRGNLTSIFAWITQKTGIGTRDASYSKYVAREDAFKSRMARFVVYGHTHVYEMVPLDSTMMPDGILDQIYINSGTWRPYHELAHLDPEQEEFIRYQVMTYLAFFKDGERGGRAFEVWSGVLGSPVAPSS